LILKGNVVSYDVPFITSFFKNLNFTVLEQITCNMTEINILLNNIHIIRSHNAFKQLKLIFFWNCYALMVYLGILLIYDIIIYNYNYNYNNMK
jgi:hypothetical protein